MEFKRGYEPFRLKARQHSKFIMSCYNCDNYYQAVGDDEELCQDDGVLMYDMVVTEHNIYCTHWTPVTGRAEEQSPLDFGSGIGVSRRELKKATLGKSGKSSSKRLKR